MALIFALDRRELDRALTDYLRRTQKAKDNRRRSLSCANAVSRQQPISIIYLLVDSVGHSIVMDGSSTLHVVCRAMTVD